MTRFRSLFRKLPFSGGQMPLRLILAIVFIGQIVSIVGTVGYLSFRNGQKTVNDLASQLRYELAVRIQRELQGYFETPHEINRLNAAALTQGDLDLINGEYGESQLYQQMRIAPTMAFVYCGSANAGEFFGVLRSPDDGTLELSIGNRSNGFLRDYYSLNVRGERTHRLHQADRTYDARQRPWYQAAIANQGPTWTDIYIAFTTGLPNITASLPVYDRFGRELLGVCATDVVLPEEFRAFLRELDIGETGQAFVMNRQGDLISNSTDEPLMVEELQQLRSLQAVESQDPLVRESAQYLVARFDGFDQIQQAQQLEFSIDGQRKFLEVLPFQDGFGLDWLIVVVVPESDFMAAINANTRNTFVLCSIALIVAIAISLITARWITHPILRVTHASEAITQGNLEQQIAPSFIAEIQSLTRSFNSMSGQLKDSFTELEHKNTDLETAKAELAKKNDQLAAVINAVPGTIAWIHADGYYLGANQQLCSILNLSPDDILGNPIGFLENSPDYTSFINSVLKSDRQFATQEIPIKIGNKSHCYLIAVQKYQSGTAIVSVGIDITERYNAQQSLRIAEEKYRSIYENALEGIFQSTPEGYFLSVNPTMATIYGYDSPDDMLASITDISTQVYVNPDDQTSFQQCLDEQDQVQGFEYQIYRKDGSIIWIEEYTRSVRDNQGSLLYYEGIVKDVSDRKRREAELNRQLQDLMIEIDSQRREQEVSQITQSSYFQEIQAEIESVNLEEFWS